MEVVGDERQVRVADVVGLHVDRLVRRIVVLDQLEREPAGQIEERRLDRQARRSPGFFPRYGTSHVLRAFGSRCSRYDQNSTERSRSATV